MPNSLYSRSIFGLQKNGTDAEIRADVYADIRADCRAVVRAETFAEHAAVSFAARARRPNARRHEVPFPSLFLLIS